MLKCFFEGRLGADAELKTSRSGNQFYTMRVATDDFRDGENSTVWVRVVVSADRVGKMTFKKGSHVLVTGTLKASTYQTRTGESAVSLDVNADSIHYVKSSSNPQSAEEAAANADTGKLEKKEEPAKAKPAKAEPVKVAAATTTTADDDLPF